MRELTEAEKQENKELKRLAAKIAHRDSIRMAVAFKHGAKEGGRKLVTAIKNAHRGYKDWKAGIHEEDKIFKEQKERATKRK